MVITNYAKSRIALWLGGSSNTYPAYFIIGSGSGVAVASQTSLLNPHDIQTFTTTDVNSQYKVKWTGDWNSVEVSGTSLTEWGIMATSGTGFIGSIWSRTAIPAINFDGTNELRIEETWEVII